MWRFFTNLHIFNYETNINLNNPVPPVRVAKSTHVNDIRRGV